MDGPGGAPRGDRSGVRVGMVPGHATVVHVPMAVLGAVVHVAVLVFDVLMVVPHVGVGVAGGAVRVLVGVDPIGPATACIDVAFGHV